MQTRVAQNRREEIALVLVIGGEGATE